MSSSAPPTEDAAGGSSRAGWPDARTTRLLLAGIVLLALVVRVVYVLQTRANPFFDAPVMDPAYHVDWARAFADGRRFQEGPFFRAPLYPWFLGVVLKVFGDGLLVPRLVQCVLGACTTLLVYLLGRDAFDRRVGLLAALGAATYWVLVYFDGELLIPALAVPLDMLALWLTLRLGRRPTAKRALGAGVAWGLAAIARPNVLLLMPVLFFWLLWRAWADRRAALLAAGALTLGTLVPIAPLSAYNAAQGDFALIATQAGVNFWIGNNPDHAERRDVSTAIVPSTRPGWWEGYEDAIAQAEAASGRELRSSEVSKYYSGRAWAWIRAHPGDAFAHWLRKLRMFWSAEELGNNQPIRGFARRFGTITRFLPLGFPVVAPLGLLGLALALARRGERGRLLPLWAFLVVYTLSVVAFFVNGRFRLPVIPVLLVLGAHAALWLVQAARARRGKALAAAAVPVALGLWLALSTPAMYRQDAVQTAYQLGVGAEETGQPEAALEHYAAALAERPGYTQAYVRRAGILRALGRAGEAEAELRQALAGAPGDREALGGLVDLLLSRPDGAAEAVEVARVLATGHPSYALGHYNLGRALGQVGDARGAEAAFREAVRLTPEDARFQLGLGTALAMQDRYAEAGPPFLAAYRTLAAALAGPDRTPELEQTYRRTALQLYQVLHLSGRPADAERFLEELAVRHPGEAWVDEVRRNRPR